MMETQSAPRTVTVHVPLTFNSRGGYKIALPDAVPVNQSRTHNALLKALARAYRWRKQIENGEYASITELARAKSVNQSYACRLLRLTLLEPALVTDILNGRTKTLTLKDLSARLPIAWKNQLDAVGGPTRGKAARST